MSEKNSKIYNIFLEEINLGKFKINFMWDIFDELDELSIKPTKETYIYTIKVIKTLRFDLTYIDIDKVLNIINNIQKSG